MKSKAKNAGPEFKGFVNYELSVEQKNALKKREFPFESIDSELVRMNEAGYRVSFAVDTYSGGHACFISCSGSDNPNAGWVLSGRGSSPIKAFKQALYKHYDLFDGDWPKHLDSSREDFDD